MTTPRNQTIELVRICAALGIVVFHSGATGAELGYSGLIAFTIFATYFAGSDIGKLAKRVLVPWAFWSVFYLGWRFVADGSPFHAARGEGAMSPLASILYGTHLWFLPFIFVANAVTGAMNWKSTPIICAVLAFLLLAFTPEWRALQLETTPPVTQYLHALPAALLGVAFRDRAGLAIGGVGLLVAVWWRVSGISLPYAVGGGAVIAALLLPRLPIKVEGVSGCMMGVYLVHIAALGVFNRITGPTTLDTAVAAFAASLAGVWIARKAWPATRLVLG